MNESSEKRSRETPSSSSAEPEEKAEKGNDGKKRKLTPEEQLAAYEEALKNEDWGHQPC